MSREGWKSKFKDLKTTVKSDKNRLAHLTRSREQWRSRAERAGEQITTLEVEIAELRARLAALADRGSRGTRDQPRNPPKYTEKRIRINFPFPCPSVLSVVTRL